MRRYDGRENERDGGDERRGPARNIAVSGSDCERSGTVGVWGEDLVGSRWNAIGDGRLCADVGAEERPHDEACTEDHGFWGLSRGNAARRETVRKKVRLSADAEWARSLHAKQAKRGGKETILMNLREGHEAKRDTAK